MQHFSLSQYHSDVARRQILAARKTLISLGPPSRCCVWTLDTGQSLQKRGALLRSLYIAPSVGSFRNAAGRRQHIILGPPDLSSSECQLYLRLNFHDQPTMTNSNSRRGSPVTFKT